MRNAERGVKTNIPFSGEAESSEPGAASEDLIDDANPPRANRLGFQGSTWNESSAAPGTEDSASRRNEDRFSLRVPHSALRTFRVGLVMPKKF